MSVLYMENGQSKQRGEILPGCLYLETMIREHLEREYIEELRVTSEK